MATRDTAALLSLAQSIADQSPVDWERAEASATPEERAIIRELRVLADLATLHRSMPAVDHDLPKPIASRRETTGPAIGRWAHLDLIERLGGGTYGDVYRAWDRDLERQVALKLLHTDGDTEHLTSSSIVIEGRRLARLRHPNVVTVYGVAMHEGRVGLWMELVNGVTLEQALAENGPLGAGEAALVGIDVCRALAAIHKAGLIHRDVKTQNVMRERGGRIVLMDLGTSRAIEQERPSLLPEVAGTPVYLAPEIFDGTSASERTDLYSVGVMLYRLVTGAFPVRAATLDELRDAHAQRKIARLRDARPDLPTAFVRIVDRAIAADPNDRYATAGELESALAESTEPSRTIRAAQYVDPGAVRRRRMSWRIAVALTAMVLAAVAIPFVARRVSTPGGMIAPGTIRSLAVLPLANVSGDSAQDYFADGMTDELIDTLGRFGSLKVTSRTSVMRLKGTRQPLPEIARLLNVDAVLEGSVLLVPGRKGDISKPDRVRINARVILAGTDTQVWSDTFERVLNDALLLQKEVAEAVARAVRVHVNEAHAAPVTVQSPEAEAAYLQGLFHMNLGSRADLETAQQYFERATMLTPPYAQAHAGLAVCVLRRQDVGDVSVPDARTTALYAATTALQLDPNLPEAHTALADVKLYYDWDWAAAGAEYRRALDVNPSHSYARSHYARYLAALNRMDEALAEARLAQQADPLSVEAQGVVGLMLYYGRRYDEAIDQFKRTLALGPSSIAERAGLARAYGGKGAYPEAIAEMTEVVRVSGNAVAPVAALATLYGAAGRTADALATLDNLRHQLQVPFPAQQAAYVYAAIGDRNAAFDALNVAVTQRSPGILWARVDPRLDSLRDDPRFIDLLRRIGTVP